MRHAPAKTAAVASAQAKMDAALVGADWLGVATALAASAFELVTAELERRGFSRDDAIEVAANYAEQAIEQGIQKHSQSRMLRRCGDNVGTVARWVVGDQLDRRLPQAPLSVHPNGSVNPNRKAIR